MSRAAGWNEGRGGISFTGGGVCSLNGVLGGDAAGRGGGSGGLDSEGIGSTSPSNKRRNRSSHCCCFSLKFLRRGDVASSALFSSSAAASACRDLRRFPIHSAAVANSESRMRKKIGLSNTRKPPRFRDNKHFPKRTLALSRKQNYDSSPSSCSGLAMLSRITVSAWIFFIR